MKNFDPLALTMAAKQPQPVTLDQLLDQEERRAIHALTNSIHNASEDLIEATDLRGQIARHPWVAVAASALLGMSFGPLLMRAVRARL